MASVKAGRRTIEIGKPDKMLFPQASITKQRLAEYYRDIADTMLPHVKGRVISMHRYPDGLSGDAFYQKKAPDYFPDWVETAGVALDDGGTQRQVVVADAATLVYLADQACITPHAWLSRATDLNHPDLLVFDLDPPGDDFGPVGEAARNLRDTLQELDLTPFVQTTGSRGLHVVVPLDGGATFEQSRAFATGVAEALAARHPKRLTVEQRKSKRRGRVYLDVMRNAYGQTAVPPYAVRARPGAPVAAPLRWKELDSRQADPQRYTVGNIRRRLGQMTDPWKGIRRHAAALAVRRDRLNGMRPR